MRRVLTLSIVVAGILISLMLTVFLAFHGTSPAKTILIAHPNRGCDLNSGVCSALLPHQGEITFSILPRPIPSSSPLQIDIQTNDIAPTRIEVDFSGIEMNMGPNRLVLSHHGNNLFRGETNLPACVSGVMAWQAAVLLETSREHIVIPFRFVSGSD